MNDEQIKRTIYFTDYTLRKIPSSQIKKFKINKIIAKSNYDDEFFTEYEICSNVHPYYIAKILKYLDEKMNHENSPSYLVAVKEDYELYRFEP